MATHTVREVSAIRLRDLAAAMDAADVVTVTVADHLTHILTGTPPWECQQDDSPDEWIVTVDGQSIGSVLDEHDHGWAVCPTASPYPPWGGYPNRDGAAESLYWHWRGTEPSARRPLVDEEPAAAA